MAQVQCLFVNVKMQWNLFGSKVFKIIVVHSFGKNNWLNMTEPISFTSVIPLVFFLDWFAEVHFADWVEGSFHVVGVCHIDGGQLHLTISRYHLINVWVHFYIYIYMFYPLSLSMLGIVIFNSCIFFDQIGNCRPKHPKTWKNKNPCKAQKRLYSVSLQHPLNLVNLERFWAKRPNDFRCHCIGACLDHKWPGFLIIALLSC